MKLELPYGRMPYTFDSGDRAVVVVRAPEQPSPRPVEELVEAALVRESPPRAPRVTIAISDPSRAEPRAVFLAALRRHLPDARFTIAVATGTHGPACMADLGVPAALLRDATVVNHDGHRDADLVEIGKTSRGTPVRVHRCVVETDLVIATGCIKPHYFAGFGAGVKAIFPGLGAAAAIRFNHRLKTEVGASAGIVDGNPCREDLEEAVALIPTPKFLLNGVCGPDDRIHAVVAGDLLQAFREGVLLARPAFTVRAKRSATVIASDGLPVTASLYQAAKIAAATAALVEEDGKLIIVAECAQGIGPLEVVNEAIFRIGVLPRLPRGARLYLVSSLARAEVATTLLEYVASVDEAIGSSMEMLVVPRASQLIFEASS